MAQPVHVLSGDGLAERRLRAEHVVARALVEASTFAEAVPRILEAICSALDWEHGALWDIDLQNDELRCAEIFTASPGAFPEFNAISRSSTVQPLLSANRRACSICRATDRASSLTAD